MAAVAASFTLGEPSFMALISAWTPPCSMSCRSPSNSTDSWSTGCSPESHSRSLMTFAKALATFSCIVTLLLLSSEIRSWMPPACTTAVLFSALDPQAAAIACAALLLSSGVPFLSNATMTCIPCPCALASVVWFPGLLAHASKTALAPCALEPSSLASCIMSMSISMPPTARKMGGGLSPPSRGIHWLVGTTGAPMGDSRSFSKWAGIFVNVPAGTAALLAGMSAVLIRGVLPRCTAGAMEGECC
mmetsp:Transcript_10194/g.23860  ORF Transcript_10194/g.23860 Transcript_10194/m.23860 type:complete len:246 (-) Transcript_10194:765-1502(-)